jgi:hypothetical protein
MVPVVIGLTFIASWYEFPDFPYCTREVVIPLNLFNRSGLARVPFSNVCMISGSSFFGTITKPLNLLKPSASISFSGYLTDTIPFYLSLPVFSRLVPIPGGDVPVPLP